MRERHSRRQFLHRASRLGLGAAGLVLLGGCAVRAGQERGGVPAARIATIGFLTGSTVEATDEGAADESSGLDPLRQGLRELGWVEGENFRFEIRTGGGDLAGLRDDAAELAGLPVDLIVTRGTIPAVAAGAATSTIPVVMVTGPADPVERGLAVSIQRPGGNVTGLAQAPYEIYGKRLELLVEAAPHISRVAYLGVGNPAIVGPLGETARTLGVQMQVLRMSNEPTVDSEQTLELAFAAIVREAAEALLVFSNQSTGDHRARIVAFAAQRRLPAMYETREWARRGGLMSYHPGRDEGLRRAARYVDRILRGAQPGELPIEYPTRYELLINLRAAAALGLTIPDALVAQATDVIR